MASGGSDTSPHYASLAEALRLVSNTVGRFGQQLRAAQTTAVQTGWGQTIEGCRRKPATTVPPGRACDDGRHPENRRLELRSAAGLPVEGRPAMTPKATTEITTKDN